MYSQNSNLKYGNKEYKRPTTYFSKFKLYYNNDDYVKIDMPDLEILVINLVYHIKYYID